MTPPPHLNGEKSKDPLATLRMTILVGALTATRGLSSRGQPSRWRRRLIFPSRETRCRGLVRGRSAPHRRKPSRAGRATSSTSAPRKVSVRSPTGAVRPGPRRRKRVGLSTGVLAPRCGSRSSAACAEQRVEQAAAAPWFMEVCFGSVEEMDLAHPLLGAVEALGADRGLRPATARKNPLMPISASSRPEHAARASLRSESVCDHIAA